MKTRKAILPCLLSGLIFVVLSFAGLPGCGGGDSGGGDGGQLKGPLALSEIVYWAYQLQGIDWDGSADALADSHYDMLVIEPTRTDWSDPTTKNFDTAALVARLKATAANDGEHRKLVIAYIDIGEAEDWRWYWTWSTEWNTGDPMPADWPDYIVARDPDDWEGNYPVAYWDPDWKDILLGTDRNKTPGSSGNRAVEPFDSILDEVLDDGFDGIYLDWVEGFENQDVIDQANADGVDPGDEMVTLIQEIREYAQARNPDFIVIQQNAGALLDGRPELLDVIDGIAQEEVWYGGEATDSWNDPDGYDMPVNPTWTAEYIDWLGQFEDGGIVVFTCEYALDHADEAYEKAEARGWITYVSRRSLSRLTTTPPPGY